MKARALLAAAPGLVLFACSLSLDGFTDGATADAGPETGPIESGAGDDSAPPPDAPFDAGDASDGATLTEGCQGDPSCTRVLFITHDLFATADFGSLAGADALCERIANGSGAVPRVRNRPMQAWLSMSTASVVSRLVHGTAQYIRPDGLVLAKDFATFITDGPAYNPDLDETSHDVAPGATVWTGTMNDGASDDMLCDDWTSSAGTVSGLTGLAAPHDVDAAVETWTFYMDQPCNTVQHLYCVEK